MLNRHTRTGILLLLCAMCAFTGAYASPASLQTEPAMRYTLYIGLDDPDTHAPVMPLEEARALMDDICVRYALGFTSHLAQGGWPDETGAIAREDTLVYILYGATEQQVIGILDEVIAALSLGTVLVEVAPAEILFYGK